MILGDDFHQPGLVLREQSEILNQVEQARPVARPAQHHFQRHPARLVLALDAFPLEEPLPIRRERADAAVRAVRGDEQRVEPEELRNLRLVVRQVLVERCARGHAGLLQLDDHQRQAVDEADQIRPAGVKRAGDAELADQQEIIIRRLLPINDAQPFRFLPAALTVRHGHLDAILEQQIHFPIRRFQAHGRTVAGQFIHGGGDGLGRQRGIHPLQRRPQPEHQHHLALRLAPKRSALAHRMGEGGRQAG